MEGKPLEIIHRQDLSNQPEDDNSCCEPSSAKATKGYMCVECELSFSCATNLRRHKKTVHEGVKRFACSICSYVGVDKSYLKKHLIVHSEEKPFKCSICDYKSKYSSDLNQHQVVHSKEKPHKCDKCEATFTQAVALRKHQQKFHGGYPTKFKCTICGFVSANQYNLKKHLSVHTEKKLYTCNGCDFVCTSISALKKHECINSKEKNTEEGDKCDSTVPLASNMNNHRLSVHGGVCSTMEEEPLVTIVDSEVLDDQSQYDNVNELSVVNSSTATSLKEQLSVHKDVSPRIIEEEPYVILDWEVLPDQSEYQNTHESSVLNSPLATTLKDRHLSVHEGVSPAMEEEPIVVVDCEILLDQSEYENIQELSVLNSSVATSLKDAQLSVHEGISPATEGKPLTGADCEVLPDQSEYENKRQLTSQKPTKGYMCVECELSFSCATNLRNHRKTVHEGVKRFACSICSYVGVDKSYLKRHLIVHSEEKPFKCSICDYKSKYSSDLNQHQVVHSKEKPHKCDKCEATFTQAVTLRKHQQKFHGGYPTRFKCPTCGFITANQYNLKRHLLVHS